MVYDISGKIILITGGATGIGFRTVQELLRNGAQGITIVDLNVTQGKASIQEIIEEFGPNRAIFIETDVTKADQLEAAFQATLNDWKAIDIVINNAGIMNDGKWEYEITLNCNAVVHGTFLGLKYMGKDKGGLGGIIVNMASDLGFESFPLAPVYTATKHFIVGFSLSMGDPYHYNRTGVKILIMCPGGTNTNLLNVAVKSPLDISSNIGEDLDKAIQSRPIQPIENVSRGMITMITNGQSGSVWIAAQNEPVYEVKIPHISTFERNCSRRSVANQL